MIVFTVNQSRSVEELNPGQRVDLRSEMTRAVLLDAFVRVAPMANYRSNNVHWLVDRPHILIGHFVKTFFRFVLFEKQKNQIHCGDRSSSMHCKRGKRDLRFADDGTAECRRLFAPVETRGSASRLYSRRFNGMIWFGDKFNGVE